MSSSPFDKSSAETSAPPASVVATPQHSADQLIGQLIDDKYRVDRIIGMGGMGVVVAATQLQLDRTVAIKLVRQDMANDSDAVERLLQEARSAARIRNEHVADVLDFGILPGGAPFIVMEYLEGDDLAKVLEKSGPLPIPEAIDLILQACEAVGEAHLCGIVHRDLKPGNLFVARLLGGLPCLKVVDFGISKQVKVGALQVALTTSPRILGTPNYMAPEQMRGHASDPRVDIWALGAIVFEMLTGRQAFEADTLPRLCQKVLTGKPPPLRQYRPDAPEKLERIIARCLSKKLDERYESIAHLATRLAPFGKRRARLSLEHILAMSGAESTPGKAGRPTESKACPEEAGNSQLRPPVVEPRASSTGSDSLDAADSPLSETSPPSSDPGDFLDGPPSSDPMPISTGPTSAGLDDLQFKAPHAKGDYSDTDFAGTGPKSDEAMAIEKSINASAAAFSKQSGSSTIANAPHSITVHPRSSERRGWVIAIAALSLFSVGVLVSYLLDDEILNTGPSVDRSLGTKTAPVTGRSGLQPSRAQPSLSREQSPVPTVRLIEEESAEKSAPALRQRPSAPPAPQTAPQTSAPQTAARGPKKAAASPAPPAAIATPTVKPAPSRAVPLDVVPLDVVPLDVVPLDTRPPVAIETGPETSLPEQLPSEERPSDPWNDKNFGSRL